MSSVEFADWQAFFSIRADAQKKAFTKPGVTGPKPKPKMGSKNGRVA